jgi:hypothetical protein
MSRFHVDPHETVDIYEFDPEETISDVAPNVITIRARMTVEIAGRVSSELMQLGADNKPELHVGAHAGALLLHNIVAWRGPDFDGLPCTPANIRSLPSAESDPFIEKVVNVIGSRNQKRESPNGRSPATINTSAKDGEAGSTRSAKGGARPEDIRSASGIVISVSPSALDGRQSK